MTQPKAVTGYRQLTDVELSLINEGKALAEMVSLYVEKVTQTPNVDLRWVSIGKTDLQKGFMSITRSIAKPTTF